MEISNQKMIGLMTLAISTVLVAVFLMGEYVQSNILKQTSAIAVTFKKEKLPLISEIDNMKSMMLMLSQQQETLAGEQRRLATEMTKDREKIADFEKRLKQALPQN